MHGISFEAATLTLTAYMLCGAVGMFVGGFIAARVASVDRVVAMAMGVAALLLALCGVGIFSATTTMVVLAATGFAVGIGGPSRDMMIKKATPKGATGRVYGLVYSGLDTGFAISPIVFGVFMDRGWYGATLLGAALVLLLSVGAALGVGLRTAKRNDGNGEHIACGLRPGRHLCRLVAGVFGGCAGMRGGLLMSSSAWGLLALFLTTLLVASWPLGIWVARLSSGRLPQWM
eukprot:gene26895-48347_t